METQTRPFEIIDIEDVRIIIKAKGKHYSIFPKKQITKEEAKEYRILVAYVLFETHGVVDTPLEDLKIIHNENTSI